MNKIVMTGWEVGNPKNQISPEGRSVTTFRIGTKKRKPEGNRAYDYYRCIAFDKTADLVYKYTNQGTRLVLSGYIDTRKFGMNGRDIYYTNIVVDEVDIFKTSVNEGDRTPNTPPKETAKSKAAEATQEHKNQVLPDDDDMDIF